MLIEILLFLIAITPYLFLIMFFKRFRYIRNTMIDIENIFDIIEDIPNTVINKIYNDYEQREIRQKAVKTGQALGTQVTNLYSNGVSKVLNIDSIDGLRKDIENDPIIKDSMADIGALMVGTFGRLLAPLLVMAHTANHVAISKKKRRYKRTSR